MNLSNVAPDGLLHLDEPNPLWRTEDDCGAATYPRRDGSVIDLNCAGLRHALYSDLDGSLFGGYRVATATSMHGAFTAPRHASGVDQGAPVEAATCAHEPERDGYQCAQPGGAGGVVLASGYQQPTPPPAGLFGAPELLVLESRDKDSEDRNFAPVKLESNGALPDHALHCIAGQAPLRLLFCAACTASVLLPHRPAELPGFMDRPSASVSSAPSQAPSA
jgi:hypothetical protein